MSSIITFRPKFLLFFGTIFLTIVNGLQVQENQNRILPSRRRHQEPKVTTTASDDNVLPCGAYKLVSINKSIVIQSPNFNKSTRAQSHSCKWRLLFPGCSLSLSCPRFRLNDFFCLDYFEIKDNTNGKTQRYCGRKGPNLEINTPNNEVEFNYKTSPFFNSPGFRCQVNCNGQSGGGGGGGGVLGGILGGIVGGGSFPIGGILGSANIAATAVHQVPPSNCSCGEGGNGVKIVNGQITAIGEFPWMGALVRAGSMVPFCGASLINSRYVMTAAHCVNGRTPDSLNIILNDFKAVVGSSSGLSPPVSRTIESISAHQGYSARLDNDIALLKLSIPVDLTGDVVPVCLPTDTAEDYLKKTATVSGWGTTSEGGTLSRYLLKADVDVISNDQCSLTYPFVVTSRMMCAYRDNTDACQGDSGGPLVHAYNFRKLKAMKIGEDPSVKFASFAKYTQIGIVSWGQGCARPMKPGVYTRLTEFMPWIQTMAQDGSYCES